MFRGELNSSISIAIILLTYSLFGAVVFMHLENSTVLSDNTESVHFSEKDIDEALETTEKMKDGRDTIKWKEFKERLSQIKKEKTVNTMNDSLDIWKSLFYCFTVYTSIGYGNIVPKTDAGRIFTCIYALMGIPICLMALDRIGRFQLTILQWIHKTIMRLFQMRKESDSLPVFLLMFVIVAYMWIGNCIYKTNENWSLSESVYFFFISFTTIGFGDMFPDDSKYFMITIVYQFVGLSLMATLINAILAKIEELILILSMNGKEKNQ